MPAVSLDQIPAYLRQRVGFWAKVTGKSADELLMGHQFEILLMESILDRLGGASELPQPLPEPSTSTSGEDGLPVTLVEANAPEVRIGSDFGTFTAPWSGLASAVIVPLNGGIISMHVKNTNRTFDITGPLDDNNSIGDNYWQGFDFKIEQGLHYSFQCSIAGIVGVYVIGQQTIV